MKALTLHQPWASLVASGVKKVETRSWPPPESLIGEQFAIHAGKVWSETNFGITVNERKTMPLGAVVCTTIVHGAYEIRYLEHRGPDKIAYAVLGRAVPGYYTAELEIRVDPYGDFSVGRWLWVLTDIEKLDPPIPARGRQRLWEWEMPT